MKRFALLLGLLLATPAVADDYVLILLDTSGSMSESMRTVRIPKMKAAQQALQKVVDQMPATTRMGLLTFDGWVFHLGLVNKPAAQAAIAKTVPDGGTPLGQYMKMAADELLTTREKNHGVGTYTLLVVTDGEASDRELLERYTPDIVARGITLKTIGVNLEQSHTLEAKSVAYFPANDPQALEGALQQAIAEVPAGDDNVSEDAYAMIGGIPDGMVPEVIGAITNTITFNQPIGENPKIKVIDEKGNVSFVAQPEEQVESNWNWGVIVVVGTFVVIVVVILIISYLTDERKL